MLYTRFYDQVLTEIAAGKVQDGINLLVGMLDTVGLRASSLLQAKRELCAHRLAQMLREDPVIAHARAHPNAIAQRIALLGSGTNNADVSSTGRKIFAVTHALPFVRALRQQHNDYADRLHRSAQQGLKICLFANSDNSAFIALKPAHLEMVTRVAPNDALAFLQSAAAQSANFDLILAPDALNQNTSAQYLSRMSACLDQQGSIVVSAMLKHHLGAGWRSACLNWNPHCHDEESLERLASGAGMTARTYHDETGCVIWGELRRAAIQDIIKGNVL
jgi:hypothetical protein